MTTEQQNRDYNLVGSVRLYWRGRISAGELAERCPQGDYQKACGMLTELSEEYAKASLGLVNSALGEAVSGLGAEFRQRRESWRRQGIAHGMTAEFAENLVDALTGFTTDTRNTVNVNAKRRLDERLQSFDAAMITRYTRR